MKRTIITLLLCTIFIKNINAQCRLDKTNYQLVFEDNFDTYTNVSQMTNKWQFTPSATCWGWGFDPNAINNNIGRGEYYDQSQVSLQPGGILRLSSTKLTTPYSCIDNGTLRTFNWKSGMIQTKMGWDDPSDAYIGTWDNTGFRYGMFEIRCKLPAQSSCPAFWLYGGNTEIDIFEAGEPNQISNNIHDWSIPTQDGHLACQTLHDWDLPIGNFTSDFHTYTCVWTPTKITYFFDNKELRTVTNIQTHPFNCQLICNLGMWPWNNTNTFMDVDYIKVYKPLSGNYSSPYKPTNDFVNTNIFKSQPIAKKVSAVQSSIAINPNNQNEIFYRGTDDRIYKSSFSGGNWMSNVINFNYNAPLPNCLTNGSLKYNPTYNYILYAGKDNRIQYFSNQLNNNWHWFIDDNFNSTANAISSNPNSMDIMSDGKIAYRGLDNKIHIFQWNSATSKWVQLAINYTYGLCAGMADADFVAGDVIVEQGSNNIIYRGRDGRLQLFWQSSPFVYQHGWIDNNWNTSSYLVSNNPGTIISTPKGIFYRGTDDKLHRFYWNSAWTHQVSNYTYGLCAGMPDADYVNGNLSYLPLLNYVLYIGRDGRIQRFEIPISNTSTAWGHNWIDDYWNTQDFISYNSSFATSFGSLVTCVDGKMIYNNERRGSVLSYFKNEPCEILNPTCNNTYEIRRMANPSTNTNNNNAKKVEVYPNPSTNSIQLKSDEGYKPTSYEIYNIQGVCVIKKSNYTQNGDIDISFLPSGIFIVRTSDGNTIINSKFTKQ